MKEEQALRLLVEGTVSETGLEFFRALVRNLAAALGTAGAWVTEYLPAERRLRPYAFWLNGAYLEDYEQPIDHTPCEAVLKCRDLLHIPDHLGDLYPLDPEVRALNVVSYMGVPLLDSDGAIIGHLAVMHDQPLPAEPHLRSLFAIFAARAAAEQRRLKVEREVRAREEQLSALLESAMDGIILLRSDLAITRVNPAARRLFGCADEDLIGQSIREFLQVDSASRVNTFLKEIHASPALSRQLWIPQNLTVLRWDRSTFPAEATLSCFENRGETFYTLILRNVDERIEAEQRIQTLTVQTEYLREEIRALHHFDEIIGQSAPLRTVLGE
ncbi:MAG: PAS domain S-box protein, partial [Limisphaerales bacterium]